MGLISKSYKGVGSWRMWNKIGCTIIAPRAATFDLLTNRYLADHPDATVLHLGCGMDSRVFRLRPLDKLTGRAKSPAPGKSNDLEDRGVQDL